ncbi:MAG: ABC transporter ATP-binding protein [Actinomycetota bacterium]
MADIRLVGLGKEFDAGGVVAVRDLTLTFREGSTTCLLGPSGCGKTTLMRMIAGLEVPTTGKIFFGDEDVTRLETSKRNLGMVFQYPVVYRGATVREDIGLPLRVEKLPAAHKAARVDEVIALLGLEEYANHPVDKLNSATRQKVAVARAVARQAPIILFDEPITNVDPDFKLQLKRTLRELFSRLNQTIIYVTHDQTEAMTLADDIALMRDGSIEQMAPPRDLYGRPESVFAGWFLGNPGMNFVPVESQPAVAAAVLGGAVPDGVTAVGFRPEDVLISSGGPQRGAVEATLGHVSLATGGQHLARLLHADLVVKAKLPWDSPVATTRGSQVWWSVPLEKVRAFDRHERAVNLVAAEQ